MERKNEVTRNLLEQEPGRVDCHANTANTRIIAQRKPARHNGGTPYRVTPSTGESFRIVVTGRVLWALTELRKAGQKGITSVENPAPRLAAYVHDLRGLGVEIETITEPHEGAFPGWHGRYVLRSGVTLDWKGGAQ